MISLATASKHGRCNQGEDQVSIYNHFTETELEVLRLRAERAANVGQDRLHDNRLSAVRIAVRSETYALLIDAISAVYEKISVTPVPCTPDYVVGIANIRGHIIPVLDLAELLHIPGESSTDSGTLFMVEQESLTIAFRVDALKGVVSFAAEEVIAIPQNLSLRQLAYFQGALPDGMILLDVRAMMNDDRISVSES
jgi:purine-binding chemotaxis protein CheW